MNTSKIAAKAAIAGALGAVVLSFGAGTAAAAPGPGMPPGPHIVGGSGQGLSLPPGHWFGGPHGVPCT